MSLRYLLDGYNIIHQMPALAGKAVDEARNRLVAIVAVNRPQGNNEATIVFDGHPGLNVTPGAGSVSIVFSLNRSADDCIKDIVAEAKIKSNVILVSDDRELQLYVRKLGGKIVTVKEFIGKIKPVGIEGDLKQGPTRADSAASKSISLTQAQKINRELEDIWLKKDSKRTPPNK